MSSVSTSDRLSVIIKKIIADDLRHAHFLNTLSLMENTGARKISASECAHTTSLMVLKHAAEEHRHAYYLRKQIERLSNNNPCPTYESPYLIIPVASTQYLNKLDVLICRYIKNTLNLHGAELYFAAYLLVTYAIELRADLLYPVYQQALTESGSKVTVKSIILEEQGHLEEMITQLESFSPEWAIHAAAATSIEERLFAEWQRLLGQEIDELKPLTVC
jgi:hypothetical protein